MGNSESHVITEITDTLEKLKNLEKQENQGIYRWGQKTKINRTMKEEERLRREITKQNDSMNRTVISVWGSSRSEMSTVIQALRSALNAQINDGTLWNIGEICESTDYAFPFHTTITNTHDVESIMEPDSDMNDVSCVVLLLKYNTKISTEMRRKLKLMMTRAGEGMLTYHLVLTHLEECDPQFKHAKNLPNIYESDMVQEAVNEMSQKTGIPPYAISFVNSYEQGTELDTNTAILHLKILQRVIRSALDQEEKKLDKKRQMELVYQATEI